MASAALNRDKVVFRDTAARIGRHISVTPATSATTHLSYGRIRLDRDDARRDIRCRRRRGRPHLPVGNGNGRARAGPYALGRFDALYVPRDSTITVETGGDVDIAEFRRTGRSSLSAAARALRGREGEPRPELPGGRAGDLPHAQHPARQEHRGRPPHGGRHWSGTGPLDQLAAARALEAARGDVRLLRHAAAGLRHPDGLHRHHEPERVEVVRDGDAIIMPRATTRTSRSRATRSASSGSWRRTARSKTGCSGSSTCSRTSPEASSGLEAGRASGQMGSRSSTVFSLDGRIALVTGASSGLGAGDGDRAGRGWRRRGLSRRSGRRRTDTMAESARSAASGRHRRRPERSGAPPARLVDEAEARARSDRHPGQQRGHHPPCARGRALATRTGTSCSPSTSRARSGCRARWAAA